MSKTSVVVWKLASTPVLTRPGAHGIMTHVLLRLWRNACDYMRIKRSCIQYSETELSI